MPHSLPRSRSLIYEAMSEHVWTAYATEKTLLSTSTPFQKAEIHLHSEFGKMLFLDGELQSASRDEFIYHETIVHPAMVAHPFPKRVAILGGGEGATAREVLRHPSVERAVMIDIDRAVVDFSRRHLPEYSAGSFSDPRLETVIGDAYAWMQATRETFDVIVSDLTEPAQDGPSHGLFSVEFFRLLQSRLSHDGVLSMQASHGNLGRLDSHLAIRKNLQAVFDNCQTMLCHIPSFGCHWCFTVASTRLDPASMTAQHVDERLQRRGLGELRYYDGTTHRRLFSLPRYLRQALAVGRRVKSSV